MSGESLLNVRTDGSVAALADIRGGSLVLQAVALKQRDYRDELRFDALSLTWGEAGPTAGNASGTWLAFSGDLGFSYDFEAGVTASLDTDGVRAEMYPFSTFAFDPLYVTFSEPMAEPRPTALSVTLDGNPVTSNVTWAYDERPGYVLGAMVTPDGFWPAGNLEASLWALQDAAGNSGEVGAFGTFEVSAPPQTSLNMDFESGDEEWFGVNVRESYTPGRRDTMAVFGDPILPPQGNAMDVVQSSSGDTRLAGYFMAPEDAEELCASVALVGTSYGATLELISAAERQVVDLATEFETFSASTENPWSGFKELCLALPLDASNGFWMTAAAPQPPTPPDAIDYAVLVDNIQFR